MSNEPSPRNARPSRKVAKWSRWLHIYLSMISFGVVFFFSVTGLTLNHPDWFGDDEETLRESQGELPSEWVAGTSDDVARLEIVEFLRGEEHVHGALDEITVDEYQVVVIFRAPAYTADVFIDRETAGYELTEVSLGFVAEINDLHKGRDAGDNWSLLIDVSAVLMVLVSLTGGLLILFMKRHRGAGLLACLTGVVAAFAVYWFLIEH